MAQVTKQFTENSGPNKSVWSLQANGTNATTTGGYFDVQVPTIKAKYSYSGKKYAQIDINQMILAVGADSSNKVNYTANWQAWASGTQKTLTREATSVSVDTSNVFNASNKTSKTVNVYMNSNASVGDGYIGAASTKNADGTGLQGGYGGYQGLWGPLATVTLNAPPTCSYTQVSSDTPGGFYANTSTATVTISSLSAKFGGDITECKLTIGSQSATRTTNGDLSIKLNAVGTFTPTITVKDSRGQTRTYQLNAITVTATPIYVKINGTWKIALPTIKDGGAWKTARNVFVKQGTTWKQIL